MHAKQYSIGLVIIATLPVLFINIYMVAIFAVLISVSMSKRIDFIYKDSSKTYKIFDLSQQSLLPDVHVCVYIIIK